MSTASEVVPLARDCRATTVPDGEVVIVPGGTPVRVLQALGASITVQTERGQRLRLDLADADAVGVDQPGRTVMVVRSSFTMDQVTEALRTVYDPEIPVDVVDLGLVYRCEEQVGDDGRRTISIDLSMTSPGCGMGDVLRSDVERVVGRIPGVDGVEVHVVLDPPWSLERMSEAARLQLGLL